MPLCLRLSSLVCLLACLSPWTGAQTYEEAELYVADRGIMMDGSDGEVRLYSHVGNFIGVLPQVGTGQIRGIDTATNDVVYIARGDEIRTYTGPMSTPDTVPFASGTKAQDVAINPVTGNVWCSFGTNSSNAKLLEVSPLGTLLRTVTSSLISHPRSMDWSYDGQTLYVCNQNAANVVAVNNTTGNVVLHANLNTAFAGIGPQSLSASKDTNNLLYVSGDYGGPNQIVQVSGASGAATVTSFIDYSMLAGFTAPADGVVDNHGNVWFTCRDGNMGVPGVYCYSRATALPTVLPYIGTEHLSPIDIAFRKSQLTMTITSLDGVDTNGTPKIPGGQNNTVLVFNIEATDYASSPYGILYSFISPMQFAASANGRPFLGSVPIERPDPRNLPLFFDDLLLQSVTLIQAGGVGAMVPPSNLCPGSMAGFFMHPQGLIGANGKAQALLTFPSMPCLPPNFEYYVNFAIVIVDGTTGPLQLGLVSSRLNCVRLGG